MGQVIFVTWRESVEALLVIGILYAWLNNNPAAAGKGKKYLFGGIVAGLALAVLLALALIGVTEFFGERARTIFEICMLFVAAALIVQMVFWMKTHGQSIKKDLETGLKKSVETAHWWGVFLLAMIAVGREGSETVMFLSGTFLGLHGASAYGMFTLAALVGFALALLTFYILQLGGKYMLWKYFFRITEILLLFLGGALFMQAVEKLIGGPLASVNFPSFIYASAWDTSAVLSDGSLFGGLMASIFGYRSHPVWYSVIAFVVYWVIVLILLKLIGNRQQMKAA